MELRLQTTVVLFILKLYFLSLFRNGNGINISDIVEKYHSMCPYIDLCYSPSITQINNILEQCCFFCSCSDDCGLECCPDKIPYVLSDDDIENINNDVWDCVYPQYKPYKDGVANSRHAIKMISKCPLQADVTQKKKCETDYLSFNFTENISNWIPLTDSEGNVYKNAHCGACNGATGPFENWQMSIECIRSVAFLGNIKDIPKVMNDIYDCNIIFKEPIGSLANGRPAVPCSKLISKCNETGLWDSYDKTTEVACLSYTSTFDSRYKNVHCAICNERYGPQNDKECDSGGTRNPPHSYVALLDFNRVEGVNSKTTESDIKQRCSGVEHLDELTVCYLLPFGINIS